MKYFLLVLFLGYFGSVTLFVHTHMVNGVQITHSHPYNPFTSDALPGHQHSANELMVIDALSHFLTAGLFLFFAFKFFERRIVTEHFRKTIDFFHSFRFLSAYGLRPPPSFISE